MSAKIPGPPVRRVETIQFTGFRLPWMHPHMLRHTFVTTMLDAGVDLRDVQIAARHADPRTTMRYDRARKNLDRHPDYILAAYMASGTSPRPRRTVLPMSAWAMGTVEQPVPHDPSCGLRPSVGFGA
jgi:hypothetical protein